MRNAIPFLTFHILPACRQAGILHLTSAIGRPSAFPSLQLMQRLRSCEAEEKEYQHHLDHADAKFAEAEREDDATDVEQDQYEGGHPV